MIPDFLMVAGAPNPVAPFSHAVRIGPWLLVTGQMPTWPDDDARQLPEGITAQTQRVVDNLKIVLAGCDMAWSDIVQARIYLTAFERDYAEMNTLWRSLFPAGRLPARTCIGVTALARNALVEIDLVGYKV
jgi:reactive intermediate/imine deaminase